MAFRNNPNQNRNQVRINFQPPGQRGRRGQNAPPPPRPIVVKYKDLYQASLLRLRKCIEVCFDQNKLEPILGETDTIAYLKEHISDTINGETLLSFCIFNELNFKNRDDNIKFKFGADKPVEKQPDNCPPETMLPPDESRWPVRLEVAKYLLDNGLEVNKRDPLMGWSCVHVAASKGDLAFLQLVATYGMEANIRNKDGLLPASLAFNAGHFKCADYLDRKSLNLACSCRCVIISCLGKCPQMSIKDLPIAKSMKIFLVYENPYPGFVTHYRPEMPFTREDLARENIHPAEIVEFIKKYATDKFLTTNQLENIPYEDLVAIYNKLYRTDEFREVECTDEVIKSRYVQFEDSNGEKTATNQDRSEITDEAVTNKLKI